MTTYHTHQRGERLLIVVPCYNEEPVIEETARQLTQTIEELESAGLVAKSGIVFVDDGSKDRTWPLIEQLSQTNPRISGIKLAHNVGHQNALWAGLEWAVSRSDMAISIDADLQDDRSVMAAMVEHYVDGADIVYGARAERKTDTFFKRTTAQGFYKVMLRMGVDLVYNHADYRLMSRRALEALLSYPERNIFLRGMVKLAGFPSATVYYDRSARMAGESKYPLGKMINFAIDGITSFSVRPLRYIVKLGLIFVLIAIAAIIYSVFALIFGHTIPGWTSILVSIWLVGGVLLLSMGIMGEYVGKIFTEVKRRPRYFIEKEV